MKGDHRNIPSVSNENLRFSGTFCPKDIRAVDHLIFSYGHGHLGYHSARHNYVFSDPSLKKKNL